MASLPPLGSAAYQPGSAAGSRPNSAASSKDSFVHRPLPGAGQHSGGFGKSDGQFI